MAIDLTKFDMMRRENYNEGRYNDLYQHQIPMDEEDLRKKRDTKSNFFMKHGRTIVKIVIVALCILLIAVLV
ncbi:hypothetical protein [Candidatus Lokiarchaeum ossiferum]|uniref:hypothetical protein n=1 Tax=Candidatus Lokiarchaeum ossiferum TaxID=2951803 RepID=UPI00352C8211